MLITETSRKIKARQSLYGKRNAVKQFVIMTPENPMGLSVTAEENAKRRKKFENMLTDGGLYAYPVRGKYNTTEHSYIVFNIPLNLAKEVAKTYDQQSFIFAIVKGENDVEFQYWEKNASEQDKDAKGKDKQYHYVESKEQFIKFDNDKDLFFTEIGRNFKFSIPFDIFEAVDVYNDLFDVRCQKSKLYENEYQKLIIESCDVKHIGSYQLRLRSYLYGSLYKQKYESPEALEMNEIISK